MLSKSLAFFSLFILSLFNPLAAFGATISGTLTFDGAPAPESWVTVRDLDGIEIARYGIAPDGAWFSENLPPGTYYVTARGEEWGRVSEIYNNHDCPWEACDVSQGDALVLAGDDIPGVDFDLQWENRAWRIRGSLLDGDEQPIPGGVRLFNVLGWPISETWPDHTGHFESEPLPNGTYYAVSIFTEGMQDEAWDDAPCTNLMCDLLDVASPITIHDGNFDNLDFVLEPLGSSDTISGQVRGPEGPLANVQVEIRNARGEFLGGFPTDVDGHYETRLLANDQYFVVAQNEWFGLGRQVWDGVVCGEGDCWNPEFIRDHGDVVEIPGSFHHAVDFDLVLPPGGLISGQLIDAGTGLPVMGGWMVLIDALSGNIIRGTSADGSGRYWFSGLAPSQYKVLAEGVPEGYTPELYGGDHCPWPCNPEGLGATVTIDSEDDVETGIDIELDFEGTRIVGQITRSDTGEPVSGMLGWIGVDLIAENGDWLGSAGANEAGLYEFRFEEAGQYYLVATNDMDRHHLVNEIYDDIPCFENCNPLERPDADLVVVVAGETVVANFELDPGYRISGTLAFEGVPTPESWVTIWNTVGEPVAWAGNDGGGNWVSPVLPAGTYYATAIGEYFGHVSELYDDRTCPWEACDVTLGDPILLADADVDGIAFDLQEETREWYLSGTVHGPDERGVGGAVKLYNARGEFMQDMWTFGDGEFLSDPLASGTYYAVTAWTDGMLDEAWEDVPCVNQVCDLLADAKPIEVAGNVDDIHFLLAPIDSGGHISGQVRGPDGPLANVRVEVRNSNGDYLRDMFTDPEGHYRSPFMADDAYFVVAQNEQLGLRREIWDDVQCVEDWQCWEPWFIRGNGTPVEVSGTNTDGIDFDLALPPGGQIVGQMIDAGTGLPLMGGWLTLIRAESNEFFRGVGANGNGMYYFSGLEPGEYKVFAEGVPEGYTPELYGGDHCPWPCDPDGLGAVITIDSDSDVESGKDIYLDFEGTRIVGRMTRGDTGEPVSGLLGWIGVDLFAPNGDWLGGAGANDFGLYEIRPETPGDYYLLASNEPSQHHLINEAWEDIPCVERCDPLWLRGAQPVSVGAGETVVVNFELTARVPPVIDRRADIDGSVIIDDNTVIEENVVIAEHASLGIGVHVVKNVQIGTACHVHHLVTIGQNTVLGPDCFVDESAYIDKGVITGPWVSIGPQALIGKDVRIGEGAFIGANVELGKSVVVWPWVCIPDGTVIPKDGVVDTSLCY